MAKFVLTDARVKYGGADLTGFLSSATISAEIDTPEITAFGDLSRRRVPGIIDITAEHSGFFESDVNGLPDKNLFDGIGSDSLVFSMTAEGATLGDVAYTFEAQEANYSPGASHGEVYAFSAQISGDGVLVRGVVMEDGIFTSSVVGTNRQISDVPSGKSVFSAIHVTAVSGTTPTLDAVVESDVSGFASPITRLTHPQFTTVGSNFQTSTAVVTDDFWRYNFTIGGAAPSFTIFGIIGIQLKQC